MTTDKAKHYIGAERFNHIASLNKEQLTSMLRQAKYDLHLLEAGDYGNDLVHLRKVEIQLIELRLK